jgi:hypothetical protein
LWATDDTPPERIIRDSVHDFTRKLARSSHNLPGFIRSNKDSTSDVSGRSLLPTAPSQATKVGTKKQVHTSIPRLYYIHSEQQLTIYNYMHIVNKSIPQMAKSPLVSRGRDVIEPSYFGAIIRRLIVNHDMPAQSHV